MERKLLFVLIAVALAAFLAGGLLWHRQAPADGTKKPDKPIMYMTPSDLFSDPKLKELAEAAQHGDTKKIDTLIARGVNVNGKGRYGITPLFSALQAGNKAGFKALLDHSANPNNIWTDGYTLMNTIAEYRSDPYFMKLALEHGGNPNLVEPRTGQTPLLAAASIGEKSNIPLLINAGANLNYQTPVFHTDPKYPPGGGETAMMLATTLHFEVVYELLKAGADYRLKDGRGRNLEDYIIFSFGANVPDYQSKERDEAMAFLKAHDAWNAPPRVENLRASTKTTSAGDTYRLSWDPVPGADHYDLFRSDSAGLSPKDIKTTEIEITEPGSENWQAVWWGVRACTKTKCGGVSEPVFIDISDKSASLKNEPQESTTPQITNYEAPGNLQATHEIRCVGADKLNNRDTPADLYPALIKCLNQGQYDKAVFISAIAGAYATFDSLRVADDTAHDAKSVFMNEIANSVPKPRLQKFAEAMTATINGPDKLSALCAQLERIGPPNYYPRYMVQHGMQAFTGFKTANGLVANFDAKKAWTESLTSYLHCTHVPTNAAATPQN
ncbi:MAG: ankyrin repeat domain-containing protein [Terriglobia bacterium]